MFIYFSVCLLSSQKYTKSYYQQLVLRYFFNKRMKQLFSLLIHIVLCRAAKDVCLDDFYTVGNTECFDMSFPWVTFPEKYWPMIRVFSEPLPLKEINITLHIFNENHFIQVNNKTEFEQFYNQDQVRFSWFNCSWFTMNIFREQ